MDDRITKCTPCLEKAVTIAQLELRIIALTAAITEYILAQDRLAIELQTVKTVDGFGKANELARVRDKTLEKLFEALKPKEAQDEML